MPPGLTQLPFLGLMAGIYPQVAGPSPLGLPGYHSPTTAPSYNFSVSPSRVPVASVPASPQGLT